MPIDADVTTIRMPHTGLWVPDRSLTVTRHGRSWVLNSGRTVVGWVENWRCAADTTLYPRHRPTFSEQHLADYAALCRTAEDATPTPARLLDLLSDEAEMRKIITSNSAQDRLTLRLMDATVVDCPPFLNGTWSSAIPDTDARWGELSRRLTASQQGHPDPGQWWQAYYAGQWLDITARPDGVNPERYY